jgi:hypothetical protein
MHFHVPLFVGNLGAFASTRDFLGEVLPIRARAPASPHLEVETYAWDVLPEGLRTSTVEEALARELRWVLGRLAP